jgi:hypothetical protein
MSLTYVVIGTGAARLSSAVGSESAHALVDRNIGPLVQTRIGRPDEPANVGWCTGSPPRRHTRGCGVQSVSFGAFV